LNKSDLFAISDVDTRALVTYIRENGAMNAIISTDVDNIEGLKKQLAEVPDMNGSGAGFQSFYQRSLITLERKIHLQGSSP
jgi:carbamoylphosphate synthase small subunit